MKLLKYILVLNMLVLSGIALFLHSEGEPYMSAWAGVGVNLLLLMGYMYRYKRKRKPVHVN